MITLKELAKELKLSLATVSMALNNSPLVADETKAKVKALAEKLEYVPNNLGRGLQSRKSRTIGYLLGNVTTSFFDEILQGIGSECTNNNYGLMTSCVGTDFSGSVESQIQILLEKNVDGVILSFGDAALEPYIERFKKREIPFIFCSIRSEKYSYVMTDDYNGGRLAAEHLIKCGHRNILCSELSPSRLAGNIDVISNCKGAKFMSFKSVKDVPALIEKNKITAIAAYSDFQAIDIMWMLKAQGYGVPEDISIVGFDDIWFASRPEFKLTTVAQKKSLIGSTAVLELMKLINNEKSMSTTLLKPDLVIRDTVKTL